MESVTYRVGDLRKLMAESSSEFKAKLGDGVESADKENSGKAYKDAEKRAKDFDGGGKEGYWKGDAEYKKEDYNGTTLDYNPENATDEYKKRVHAQAKGYTSEAEMNNDIEKIGDFSDNEKIYQGIKDAGHKKHEDEKEENTAGLKGRCRKEGYFDRDEMYESVDARNMREMIDSLKASSNGQPVNEQKSVKTVYFKKTCFLSEEHMMSRIPDEFKCEGSKFRMKDKTDNIYLLEWRGGKAVVLEHNNKNGMNESMSRMKELMDYQTKTTKTDNRIRTNEENEINTTLNRMRELFKD